MKVSKVKICGNWFLLPEPTVDNDYEFPTYILENKKLIEEEIERLKLWTKDPISELPPRSPQFDVESFKKRTGIIGSPFTMHDVTLYLLDNKNVEVVMEMSLDDV